MTRTEYATAYRKGYTSTVRFLLYTGVPSDQADEIAQAGWTRGWDRRDQLDDPSRIVSWINRISLNLFRNRLRRQRPTEELSDFGCRPQTSPTTLDV